MSTATTPPPWDEPPPLEDPPPTEPEYRAAVPQDPAAERYVIGAALLDRTQITACTPLLTASDFWNPAHETIWRTLLTLNAAGAPTEPQAVAAHLLDTDTRAFNRLGGAPYLFELMQTAQVPASAPYYATRVEELARRREAIRQLERGLAKLRQPGREDQVDEVLTDVAAQMAETKTALANLTTPTTWSPMDLTRVLQGEHLDPPPTMLERTDGVKLFYDNTVHVIAGESSSGKTWLALLAAVQILNDNGLVTFIDFEDRAERVVGRLLALGATPDQIRTQFSYVRPDRPLDDGGRNQLGPAITGRNLVIIDGVTEAMTLHGLDLNSNQDSAHFQALLPRWAADHGPAVAMIDHVVKDKDRQGRFALGAQHKLAGIDGAQYLVTIREPFARGKRGFATIDVGKDRPGHVLEHAKGKRIADFTLDASTDGLVLTATLTAPGDAFNTEAVNDWMPTVLMERVSRYVEVNPGETKNGIEKGVTGNRPAKRQAIDILLRHGYIRPEPGKNRSVNHYSTKPYREGDKLDETATEPDEPDTPLDPWEAKE